MLSARLVVEATDFEALEGLRAGVGDVEVVGVEAGVSGELLRVVLRPLMLAPVSPIVADPLADRTGPVLRIFVQADEGGCDGEGREG